MSAYRRPPRFAWWWGHRAYVLFVVRELTSVAVGAYALLLLILVQRLTQGRTAYEAYLQWLTTPGMIALHLVGLAAAIYHSVTWFGLAPKAMAVQIRGRRVPPSAIVAVNYSGWILASALVAWLVLRGS